MKEDCWTICLLSSVSSHT